MAESECQEEGSYVKHVFWLLVGLVLGTGGIRGLH